MLALCDYLYGTFGGFNAADIHLAAAYSDTLDKVRGADVVTKKLSIPIICSGLHFFKTEFNNGNRQFRYSENCELTSRSMLVRLISQLIVL